MDLEEFRAFLAVVETGSFLAAATNLGMARATLRRRVEALEARAGVPLLERSPRGVVATESGAVLAARGRAVLQEASALVASVRELGREPVGELRVTLPVGLPPQVLAAVLAATRAAYPKLALDLRFADDPAAAPLTDADLLVHFGAAAPPGSWLSYEVLPVEERLIASAEYLRRRGAPRGVEDLAGHELFSWCAPGEDGRVWATRSGETVEVAPALICADAHLIHQCVHAGLGIGYVPDGGLPVEGAAAPVVPVLPELIGRASSLRVSVPEALASSPKLRAVVRQVQGFAEQTFGARAGAGRGA